MDEDLHSRQLAVYGRETMARMARSGILIAGLGGLGVETAKNVVLSGVKSVTLLDDAPCTYADLSSQFYLTPAHVEKALTRAAACVEQVKVRRAAAPRRPCRRPRTRVC